MKLVLRAIGWLGFAAFVAQGWFYLFTYVD